MAGCERSYPAIITFSAYAAIIQKRILLVLATLKVRKVILLGKITKVIYVRR